MFESIKEQYGLKAWWGAFVMRSEMKYLGGIVDHTYLPILRLTVDDPSRVEKDWAAVKAGRDQIKLWDSPYARWKKTYGNFVRELEWAYGELKPTMSEADFEDLVVFTMCGRLEEWVGWMKPLMKRMPRGSSGGGSASGGSSVDEIGSRSLGAMWPIVGDIEVKGVEDGVIICHIPDCAMHWVVSETEPQTNACLYGCKAACEAFMGPDDPMSIHFEPNIPAFDCVMRVATGGRSAAPLSAVPVESELASA